MARVPLDEAAAELGGVAPAAELVFSPLSGSGGIVVVDGIESALSPAAAAAAAARGAILVEERCRALESDAAEPVRDREERRAEVGGARRCDTLLLLRRLGIEVDDDDDEERIRCCDSGEAAPAGPGDCRC